jgi:hypothetical protein
MIAIAATSKAKKKAPPLSLIIANGNWRVTDA